MIPGLRRAALGVLAAALVGSCGARPEPAPEREMADRVRSRIALIDFVVKDPERRARVVEAHLALEELTLWHAERERALTAEVLAARRGDGSVEALRETLRALWGRKRAESRAFLDRYARIQMTLRDHLTPDEFARLDAIR